MTPTAGGLGAATERGAPAWSAASRTAAALVAVLALALLLMPSQGQTPDGLSYASDVRDGGLAHPHHLGYAPAAWLLHRTLGLEALRACLLLGALHLVPLAWASWGLARRTAAGPARTVVLLSLLLGLRGVMFYTTHAEVYLPALAWLAVTVRLATSPRLRPAPLAGALALAVLGHQTNVLLVPALLAAAMGDRARLRAVAAAVTAAGLVVVAVYAATHAAAAPDRSLAAWMLTYPQAGVPGWGSLSHLSPTGLAALGVSQARNLAPVPETASGPGALAALAIVAALVGWHAVRLRRGGREGPVSALRRLALTMLATYLVFFLWWLPSDPDFFLATAWALWLLAILAAADWATAGPGFSGRRWSSTPVLAAAAMALVTGNLTFTVVPQRRTPAPQEAAARALDAAAPADAVIVADYAVQQELRYRTARTGAREGFALCRELQDGAPPAYPLVIARGLVDEMLAAGDRDCLLRLLTDDSGARRRRFRALPGGSGLLITEEWSVAQFPSDPVSDVQRELAGSPPKN